MYHNNSRNGNIASCYDRLTIIEYIVDICLLTIQDKNLGDRTITLKITPYLTPFSPKFSHVYCSIFSNIYIFFFYCCLQCIKYNIFKPWIPILFNYIIYNQQMGGDFFQPSSIMVYRCTGAHHIIEPLLTILVLYYIGNI